jgi:hypothetical protein
MGWQERFRNIRQLADERLRQESERVKQDRQSAEDLVSDRRQLAKSWAPRIEKVCKTFSGGVKGRMRPYRVESWSRGNAGWRVRADFGGINVETWPWLHDTSKPRILRGLWLQFLGPNGEELVSESKAKGIRLDHNYELGREEASSSGFYYWKPADSISALCVSGYFLAKDDFTEESLADALEEMGLDLVKRLSASDFSRAA